MLLTQCLVSKSCCFAALWYCAHTSHNSHRSIGTRRKKNCLKKTTMISVFFFMTSGIKSDILRQREGRLSVQDRNDEYTIYCSIFVAECKRGKRDCDRNIFFGNHWILIGYGSTHTHIISIIQWKRLHCIMEKLEQLKNKQTKNKQNGSINEIKWEQVFGAWIKMIKKAQ